MRIGPALTLVAPLVAALAATAVAAGDQARVVGPTATPVTPSALLSDIQRQFDAMERSIEMAYGRLIQDAKSQKQALEDKIKSLESQIEKMKQAAKKIEHLAQKIEQLLPKIVASLGTDPGTAKGRALMGARNAEVADLLAAELAKAGLDLSRDEIRAVTDAVRTGGEPAAQRQLKERLAAIDKAIESAKAEVKSARNQLAALDQEIAKLQTEKEKAVAEVRNQKAKALKSAEKTATEAERQAAVTNLRAIIAALHAQYDNLAITVLRTPTPTTNRR